MAFSARTPLVGVLVIFCIIAVGGCSSSEAIRSKPISTANPDSSAQVVALVDNTPVFEGDLSPILHELAGNEALRELVLDRALASELQSRGLRVSDGAMEREKQLLWSRISGSQSGSPAPGVQEEVFRSRGLGPERIKNLLWRNAALRLLVAETVVVPDEDVESAMELAYGPKVIARVIVTENEREASQVLRILGPHPDRTLFARIAEQRSIDATASRGGLLQPFSLADPAYPLALRQALAQLEVGEVSAMIALKSGTAVVLHESNVDAITPPEGSRDRLRHELRIQMEREAMDQMARKLIRQAKVDVLDRSLGWSWDNR